ncbi:MAG: transcriptional antiterminator NusG [Spirochaetes bacterium]|nr:MAG: transcriptional antiterminator NusG [Spirochaetota bacterium]
MAIYVLQVITGKELEARKMLNLLELESIEKIIFPRREMIQRKKGKRYKKIQPLFPGYLFLETEDLTDALIHDAGRCPNVIHFLPDNRRIKAISEDDERLLRPLLRDDGLTPLINIKFNENDRVIILEGPLKGQEGLILKVDRRRRRLRVKLSLYETGHLIDFGYRDLGVSK